MTRSIHRFIRAAGAWRNTSGNVAIMSALMAPILLGTAGFAIDIAYTSYVKQKLNRAAEAAVIGAVSQSAATAMGGFSNTNGLQQYGTGLFAGNISQLSIAAVTPTLTVASNGNGGIVANASYTAQVPTLFSGLVGINSITVNGSAQATASPTTYIRYYIIVDISQSMGIGATQTDMSNLYNRVVAYNNGSGGETGCVFGCHVKVSGQSYTNEYLAHNVSPKITLRVDSAVTAIQNIINDASSAAASNKNIQIGLYTMSEDPVSGNLVNTVSAPSSNYSSLYSSAATIDLGNNTSGGSGDSDFTDQLSTFNNMVAANGSGASASSPINYVFIITDGLSDVPGNCNASGHCTGPFNSSLCNTLKSKATVGVIYTTYNEIYNNNNSSQGPESNYSLLVAPYVSQLAPNLQACASSSNYYFEATDGPAINTAMQALFASTQQVALLQK